MDELVELPGFHPGGCGFESRPEYLRVSETDTYKSRGPHKAEISGSTPVPAFKDLQMLWITVSRLLS